MGGFSTIAGVTRHTELLEKEVNGVIDHADGSITASKLAPLTSITLAGLTSDPPLARGRLWFRSDLNELRWTPDGTTVYVIDPAPVVAKSWNDTSYHYFNTDTSYQTIQNPAAIQLNNPATGHKRAFEDAATGYCYVHGWYLKKNIKLPGRLNIDSYIGAYHRYNATRANIQFVIADPATFDVKARNDNVPWVRIGAAMSTLGYANGSYNNPFRGYIIFTDPPSYSFTPKNPGVGYNKITLIPTIRTNILYGYEDLWSADWDIWTSMSNTSRLRYQAASSPPEPEIMEEFTFAGARCMIAKWDGEVRLWIKDDDMGLVIPLGKDVKVMRKAERSVRESINKYEKVYASGREPEVRREQLELEIRTDIADLHKVGREWRLILDHDEGGRNVIFGDKKWDGDKIAYYIYSF
ncbi:MAG: hypothetical protein QXE85_00170 [Nitrososphaerota archaeon]